MLFRKIKKTTQHTFGPMNLGIVALSAPSVGACRGVTCRGFISPGEPWGPLLGCFQFQRKY